MVKEKRRSGRVFEKPSKNPVLAGDHLVWHSLGHPRAQTALVPGASHPGGIFTQGAVGRRATQGSQVVWGQGAQGILRTEAAVSCWQLENGFEVRHQWHQFYQTCVRRTAQARTWCVEQETGCAEQWLDVMGSCDG